MESVISNKSGLARAEWSNGSEYQVLSPRPILISGKTAQAIHSSQFLVGKPASCELAWTGQIDALTQALVIIISIYAIIAT
jgi:hypothetical protein